MDEKTKPVIKALKELGVKDKFLQAAILANMEKECGLIPKAENISGYKNTPNDRIKKIFGKRVSVLSDESLNEIKKDPEQFCELIYGNKTNIGRSMGNTEPGDGWKYRGRGYIQLTGKSNYKVYGEAVGVDLLENPSLLVDDKVLSAKVSITFILKGLKKKKEFSSLEEACRAVTQVIGGTGLNIFVGYGKELLDRVLALAPKYLP